MKKQKSLPNEFYELKIASLPDHTLNFIKHNLNTRLPALSDDQVTPDFFGLASLTNCVDVSNNSTISSADDVFKYWLQFEPDASLGLLCEYLALMQRFDLRNHIVQDITVADIKQFQQLLSNSVHREKLPEQLFYNNGTAEKPMQKQAVKAAYESGAAPKHGFVENSGQEKVDVVIIGAEQDCQVGRDITAQMRSEGLSVFNYLLDLQLGRSYLEQFYEKLEETQTVVALISQNFTDSNMCMEMLDSAHFMSIIDPTKNNQVKHVAAASPRRVGKLVPFYLEQKVESKLKRRIQHIHGLDWFQSNHLTQLKRLILQIKR